MTNLRFRLVFAENRRVGPGKVALLEAIASTGSITGAAKFLGMSYRRAWVLLEEMNTMFSSPVAETMHGGSRGGGATVTELGQEIITRYRLIQQAIDEAAREHVKFFERHLRD